LRTQSPTWANRRWKFVGSVFDGWTARPVPPTPIRNIVVSLGTIKRYQFRSLVDRLLAIVPPDADVWWQVGATDVSDLVLDARGSVAASELNAAMEAADVIVAHAGTGIALSAMEMGKCPVLVPRRAARREHIDDHQQQTAQLLGCAGLAVVAEVSDLTWKHLERAAGRQIVPRAVGPRIELTPRRESGS
jgi:UDP-N-acetylglucosamine transferase subunit ALG13